jgi:hypothetical protein
MPLRLIASTAKSPPLMYVKNRGEISPGFVMVRRSVKKNIPNDTENQ